MSAAMFRLTPAKVNLVAAVCLGSESEDALAEGFSNHERHKLIEQLGLIKKWLNDISDLGERFSARCFRRMNYNIRPVQDHQSKFRFLTVYFDYKGGIEVWKFPYPYLSKV